MCRRKTGLGILATAVLRIASLSVALALCGACGPESAPRPTPPTKQPVSPKAAPEHPTTFVLLDDVMSIDRPFLEKNGWRSVPVEDQALAGQPCLFVAERPPQRRGGGDGDGGGRVQVLRLDKQVQDLDRLDEVLEFLLSGVVPDGAAQRVELGSPESDRWRGEKSARWLCFGKARDTSGAQSETYVLLLAVNAHNRTYIVRALHWPEPPVSGRESSNHPAGKRRSLTASNIYYLTEGWAAFN